MKQIFIKIPTHIYNRRKQMYDNIRIVSWPHTMDCPNVFDYYVIEKEKE